MAPRLAFTALVLLAAVPARAWRETGHFTVCEIAYRRLAPEAKRAVAELHQGEFAESCTWPDTVRKSPRWKHTYDWHFINVDDREWYPETISRGGDVVQALIRMEDALRDPAAKKEDKAAALKFLAHFAGDLHQPLHIGRKSDMGGNSVKVTWFGVKEHEYVELLDDGVVRRLEPINLHKVWDLHMLERFIAERRLEDGTKYKHKAYASVLDPRPEEPGTAGTEATYLEWALESLELRRQAYQVGDKELAQPYYDVCMPIANARMLQAGVRLADVLNRVFGGAPLRPQDARMRDIIRRALERK